MKKISALIIGIFILTLTAACVLTVSLLISEKDRLQAEGSEVIAFFKDSYSGLVGDDAIYDYGVDPSVYCAAFGLNDKQIIFYQTLCDRICEHDNNLILLFLPDLTEKEMDQVIDSVYADHPEFFWWNGSYSYSCYPFFDRMIMMMRINYIEDEKGINEKQEILETKIEEILSDIDPAATPYEKLTAIHDYIGTHTTYDWDHYDEIDSEEWSDSDTAYGCIVNGLALCNGYAQGFELLAQKAGIPCCYICGKMSDGESKELHAWNYVLLDDDYYYVDCTSDDLFDEVYPDFAPCHTFYCFSDDELAECYEICDYEAAVPECGGTKYDYFLYHGLYVEKYDEAVLESIAASYADRNYLEIKFGSTDERKEAVDNFFSWYDFGLKYLYKDAFDVLLVLNE